MSNEIVPMLVLSTGHLTDATCNVWMTQTTGSWYIKGHEEQYGWFVYAQEEREEGMPEDLAACMDRALQIGCGWIMFDRDGPQVEGLTYYDW